ncbi:hypothetical protein [Vibrio phage vB_VpaS_CHI]|nr:hypothetical protein [Vibrio phage vB_VpaS_ALK]USL90097.1 hypothetical protein [Vibrio phage vB_VpaS_CHI]
MAQQKREEWLNKPKCCDNCQSPRIVNADNCIIYGRNHGDWPRVWFCRNCNAAVGCHPGTNYPMGKMATSETRQARRRAHKHFDKIFRKHGIMSRTDAYYWLARSMNIPKAECHISYFDAEQCERVVELSRNLIRAAKRKARTLTHTRGRKVSKPGHKRRPL